jgi:hypothetical protein
MESFCEANPMEVIEEGNFFMGRVQKRNEIHVPVPMAAMMTISVT